MLKLTPEQGDIIDHVKSNDGILLVHAGAGTGKTFIAKQIANLLNPRKGLYTAFNKAIVKEGTDRFEGTNMECKTFHALAYKHVKPKQKISDLTYTCITEKIPTLTNLRSLLLSTCFLFLALQICMSSLKNTFPKKMIIVKLKLNCALNTSK